MSPSGIPSPSIGKDVLTDGIFQADHGILSLEHILPSIQKFGKNAMKSSINAILHDKLFMTFLTLSLAGFGYVGVKEYFRIKDYKYRMGLAEKARKAAIKRIRDEKVATGEIVAETAQELDAIEKEMQSKCKDRKSRRQNQSLFSQLRRLLGIAIPSPTSYTSQLLIVQFFLLVLRTFLTINCVKAATTAITRAISLASFKHWVGWLAQFCLWMAGGIVVNSGLRFFESLIAINIRRELTRYVHMKYLRNINFYKVINNKGQAKTPPTSIPLSPVPANSYNSASSNQTDKTDKTASAPASPSSSTPPTPVSETVMQISLDNIDQRITRDIQVFSDSLAFLYGHSFKPVLEFGLSLHEASKDIGLKRPLLLFACSTVINLVLRSLSPSLSRIVAQEAQIEGSFQNYHNRIVQHNEEIAFLDSSETERSIVDNKLEEILNIRTSNTLLKLKKSVSDNIIKFSGMLIGGIFVHVPFLLSSNLENSQRMSRFRACEEVMLRCGSSFSEVLLLSKELDEMKGYSGRILELIDSLEVVDANSSPSKTDASKGHAIGDEKNGESQSSIVELQPSSLAISSLSKMKRDMSVKSVVDIHSLLDLNTYNPGMNPVDLQHGYFASPSYYDVDDKDGEFSYQNELLPPQEALLKAMELNIKKSNTNLISSTPTKGKNVDVSSLSTMIIFNNVTIVSPDDYDNYIAWRQQINSMHRIGEDTTNMVYPGRILIDNLNLCLPQGKSLILTGPNGSGKTSLFRTLASLWPLASGTIIKPHKDSNAMMLLPQRAYLVQGNLRDQITYPHLFKLRVKGRSNYDVPNIKFVNEDELAKIDSHIHNICKKVGCFNIIMNQSQGLDTVANFNTSLSGGERQLICFSRVLYHNPIFVIVDEGTSALHPENEIHAYAALKHAGITIFSIGHRPALKMFHEILLELDGDGGYRIDNLENERSEEDVEKLRELAAKFE